MSRFPFKGLLTQVQWHELPDLNPDEEFLLDVRSKKEVERSAIEGSVNIPLDQLRERLSEIPKDKKIVTYCHSGQRSYFASRLLRLNGYEASNLSGAWLTYHNSKSTVGD